MSRARVHAGRDIAMKRCILPLPAEPFMEPPMHSAPPPQVLSAAATGIDRFLGRYGICPDSFFGTLGLAPDTMAAPTRQMDLGLYCRMLDYGAERSGDADFGLAFGQGFTPQMLGLIGYICMSSDTLGDAARHMAAYFPWHQQGTRTEFAREGGLCWLTYRVDPGRVERRRQDALVTLGMYCNVFRHALGRDWSPELIDLEHADRGDRARIEAAFGAPVRFDQPCNALVFRAEDGARPMPGRDAQLRALLCCNLQGIGLAEQQRSTRSRAAEVVRDHLSDPALDLGFVADRLQMPRWTLQRRLRDAGLGFADLVDRERRRMAMRYLAAPEITISQVAERLGYSEPSAFVRAFRRWEGEAPTTHRKALTRLTRPANQRRI